MIVGKIRCLPVSGRAQGGRDRAPCRREHGAGEEDERVPCGWGRELRQQRSHPGEQKGCWIGRTQHDGSPRQVYSCWEQPARLSRRRGAAMTRDEILQRYHPCGRSASATTAVLWRSSPNKRFWNMRNGSGCPLEGCWS